MILEEPFETYSLVLLILTRTLIKARLSFYHPLLLLVSDDYGQIKLFW